MRVGCIMLAFSAVRLHPSLQLVGVKDTEISLSRINCITKIARFSSDF